MAQSIRDDDGVSNDSGNAHLTQIVEAAIARNPSRRAFLKAGLGASLLPFIGGVAACASDGEDIEKMLGFTSVPTSSSDVMVVPPGYRAETLTRWGDPLLAGAPEFRGDASETSAEAELQIGDNHDGMFFFGFRNADGSEKQRFGPARDQPRVHQPGVLLHARAPTRPTGCCPSRRRRRGRVSPATASRSWKCAARPTAAGSTSGTRTYNRRITGYTPIDDHGPGARARAPEDRGRPGRHRGAGHAQQLRSGGRRGAPTSPARRTSTATSAGTARARPRPLENRYGIAEDGFGYLWHTVDPRFDVNATPNEPNRFGWIVEIDPFTPGSHAAASAPPSAASSTRTPRWWWPPTARSSSTWAATSATSTSTSS